MLPHRRLSKRMSQSVGGGAAVGTLLGGGATDLFGKTPCQVAVPRYHPHHRLAIGSHCTLGDAVLILREFHLPSCPIYDRERAQFIGMFQYDDVIVMLLNRLQSRADTILRGKGGDKTRNALLLCQDDDGKASAIIDVAHR
jgi:hypothetical protein